MIPDQIELTDDEIDELLERFDQTEPLIQRGIIATTFARLAIAESLVNELAAALEELLDANGQFRKWATGVAMSKVRECEVKARAALAKAGK